MATITWSNGISGDWSDAADWTPQQVPGSGDTAEIGPGISADTAWTVSVTTGEAAAVLLVTAGDLGTLSVGAVLDVTGSIAVASGSVVMQTGGSLVTAGALDLGEAGPAGSGATLSAVTGLIAAGTLGIFDGSTLAIGGAAVALGNAAVTDGELTVGSDAAITGDVGVIASSVSNAGTIDVVASQLGEAAGALEIQGGLTGSGLIEVEAGASLTVDGDVTLGGPFIVDLGTLTLGAGAALTVGGTLDASNGSITSNDATINVGLLDISQMGTSEAISLDGGSLTQTGTAAATIENGLLLMTGGAVLSAPQLVVQAESDFGGTIDLAAGSIDIAGGLTLGEKPAATAYVTVEGSSSISAAGLTVIGATVSLSSGGTMVIGAAAPVAGAIAVANGATLHTQYGVFDANLSLSGSWLESIGYSQLSGSLTGDGTLSVGNVVGSGSPGVVEVGNATSFDGTVTIGGNKSELILDAGSMPTALIASAATVDLRSLTYEAYNLPIYDPATGLLTVGTATLDVGLGHSTADFGTGPDSGSGTDVTILAPPCFAAGTTVLSDRGEVAVEALAPGDHLVTHGGGLRPVRWVGWRRVACRRHPRPEQVLPVRVAAHAFGPGQPHRDLLLSPDHAVFFAGVLIPVRCLIDGAGIVREQRDNITYWHVELDQHDVIFADGLACESFLDTGNRAAFENGGAVVRLHPDFAQRMWDGEACAPVVVAGRKLEEARAMLRAGAQRPQSAKPRRPRPPRRAVR